MIHIATVHWHTDKWIDLQLSKLKEHIATDFKVYGFLNGINPDHYRKFDYVCDEPLEDHGIKLNLLARFISFQAKPDDLLIFLDGDAFPVAAVQPYLSKVLAIAPLCAIVRKENLSDQQPHPSFCATTVGFWNTIKGDWKKGYCWKDKEGHLVSDIGGNLLQILQENRIMWHQLLRSHSLSNHALWYGIYDNLIYHHGAGFRDPFSRLDFTNGPFWLQYLQVAISKSRSLEVRLSRILQQQASKRINIQREEHDSIYNSISSNSSFISQALQLNA